MITNLLSGGIFLIIGILIYFFPNLIAGYNLMTKEEKAKVDIKRLKCVMAIGLSLIGVIILVLGFLGYDSIIVPIIVSILGLIPIVAIAQKYDHSNK